jgi:hypothetical protein
MSINCMGGATLMVFMSMNLYLLDQIKNTDNPAQIILNDMIRDWKYQIGIYKNIHMFSEYELHNPYVTSGRK